MTIECRPGDKDFLLAQLWEAGSVGIEEEDLAPGKCRLLAFFEHPRDIAGEWRQEPDRDWVALSQAQWQPVLCGDRFFLAPEWDDTATPPGRMRLTISPGRASGTGYSTPTQLCLEALERAVQPDDIVLDIGTGSGILANAARLLGARRVIACDIDFDSVLEARRVAMEIFAGSARAVRSSSITLVVANLNYWGLTTLVREILRVAQREARFVLGGFRPRRRAAVESLFGDVAAAYERDGWVCLYARK